MVGGPGPPLKQSLASATCTGHVDPDRYFDEGLGCLQPGGEDRKPVEYEGAVVPHKLPRTPSNLSGNSDCCQIDEQADNLHTAGQCYTQMYINKKGGTQFLPPCQ